MYAIIFLSVYVTVLLSSIIWLLIEQEHLFSLYKKKHPSDAPLTLKDTLNVSERLSNWNVNNSNFGISRRRLKIIFSKFPDDPELSQRASKVRRLFFSGLAIMAGGFIILGVIMHFTTVPS